MLPTLLAALALFALGWLLGRSSRPRPPAVNQTEDHPAPEAELNEPTILPADAEAFISDALCAATGAARIDDVDAPVARLGISSAQCVEVAARVQEWAGARLREPLPATLAFEAPSVAAMARLVSDLSRPADAATQSPTTTTTAPVPTSDDIAITGIALRVAGGARTAGDLWRLLLEGADLSGRPPADRSAELRLATELPDAYYLAEGDAAAFDHGYFGLSPAEAASTDPQQRLLLQCGVEALEDAGLLGGAAALAGSSAGVFVGVSNADFAFQAPEGPHAATGSALSIAANRLSFALDLRGPSVAVDSACSSSLLAVHLACQSLRSGESAPLALVAGSNLVLGPAVSRSLLGAGFLSPAGRCRAFAADADGYARGEGVVVVALRRLADARRDGNRVYAVVAGSAANQDGRSNGLTAPRAEAQTALHQAAMAAAGVAPADVAYVEAHGTGTRLGDPIEARGLARALAGAPGPVAIGSLKSALGHLEAAAGIAGLVKAALCLQRGAVPRTLHVRAVNPQLPADRVQPVLSAAPLPLREGGVALVAAFGFGGTNVGAVLRRPPVPGVGLPECGGGDELIIVPVSAADPAALRRYCELLSGWLLCDERDVDPRKAAAALALRRSHRALRCAVVGRSRAELGQRLAAAVVPSRKRPRPRLAFVFNGQGTYWHGVGATLLRAAPAAVEPVLAQLDELFRAHFCEWSLRELLLESEDVPEEALQPLSFAVQMALVAVWRELGVEPAACVGHSLGELAAAAVAGALPLAAAVGVVATRSVLMTAAGDGAMLHVQLPEREVAAAAAGCRVSVAAVNGPASTVVAGGADDVRRFGCTLAARGARTRPLPGVRRAFHSPAMDAAAAALAEEPVAGAAEPALPLYSAARAGRLRAAPDAAFWAEHVRAPVRFSAAVAAAAADGCTVFLEIGARPVLAGDVALSGGDSVAVAAWQLRRGNVREAQLAAVAELYGAGVDVRWPALVPRVPSSEDCRPPSYPWSVSAGGVPRDEPEVTPSPSPSDSVGLVRSEVAQLLGVPLDEVDVDAPLASLGVDSLLSTQLALRLGVRLPWGGAVSAREVAALPRSSSSSPPADVGPEPDQYVATSFQQLCWRTDLAARAAGFRGASLWATARAFRLQGCVDAGALTAAVAAAVERNPVLRTTLWQDGEQLLARPASCQAVGLRVCDDALAQLDEPFDFERGPLARFWLSPAQGLFVVQLHHSVFDAPSLVALLREVLGLGGGRDAGSFAAFAAREHALVASPAGERAVAFWRDELAGVPLLRSWGTPEPEDLAPCECAFVHAALDAELTAALRRTAQRHGLTMFTLLASCVQRLVAEATGGGGDDVLLYTALLLRDEAALAETRGPQLNIVPLRSAGGTPLESARAAQAALGRVRAHQEFPFDEALRRLGLAPASGLYLQFLFTYLGSGDGALGGLVAGVPGATVRAGELEVSPAPLPSKTDFVDLTVFALEIEGRVELTLRYNCARLDEERVEGMGGRLGELASGLSS